TNRTLNVYYEKSRVRHRNGSAGRFRGLRGAKFQFCPGGVVAADLQVLGTHVGPGIDVNGNVIFLFEADQVLALTIVEVSADPVMHIDSDLPDVVAVDRVQQQADHLDRHAFGRLHQGRSTAAGAVFIDTAPQRGTDSLAGHFDQPEGADPQDF